MIRRAHLILPDDLEPSVNLSSAKRVTVTPSRTGPRFTVNLSPRLADEVLMLDALRSLMVPPALVVLAGVVGTVAAFARLFRRRGAHHD